MSKPNYETRGRPRDATYEAIAVDVRSRVARFPAKREWNHVYDIQREDDPLPLDNRYQSFRQSLVYKELKADLLARGYKVSLSLVGGFDVTIRVLKQSEV